MSTIDSTWVCEVPVFHQKMGFSMEGDHGNVLLLLTQEMRPTTYEVYRQSGYIQEGVCITNCPWPNRDFTLAVVEHSHRSIVADRFVVLQLMTTTEK